MELYIPSRLLESVENFGEDGRRWLEALPARVAQLEQEWGCKAGRAFDLDGGCSWVAPVRLDAGSEAVLKVGIPHDEARYEGEALRRVDGRGAVRLLRLSEDGFSLLMERCVPGTNLWSLDADAGDSVGAEVLRRLWREPEPHAPFTPLAEVAREWARELAPEAPAEGFEPELLDRIVALAHALAATQSRQVLLHGDFHPGNVLAAEREPWLAIDFKPLVGEPAYDLAQWLENRRETVEQSPDPLSEMRRRIDRFSALLDLDSRRVAGWALVKSLGWEWGPAAARLYAGVLDRL
jgi:streptomycin 6-kinase